MTILNGFYGFPSEKLTLADSHLPTALLFPLHFFQTQLRNEWCKAQPEQVGLLSPPPTGAGSSPSCSPLQLAGGVRAKGRARAGCTSGAERPLMIIAGTFMTCSFTSHSFNWESMKGVHSPLLFKGCF